MIGQLRETINEFKIERKILSDRIAGIHTIIAAYDKDIEISHKALAVLQKVGKETQEALEYRISELVNLALSAVFEEPYTLKPVFEVKRGKTECRLVFEKDGKEYNPIDASGGGVVDIAAFALRLTCLTLIKPRPRSLLVLDEPFRFLSADLQPKAADMLSELSNRLGIQVIMVTHNEELIHNADRVFNVSRKGDKTTIKEENHEQ